MVAIGGAQPSSMRLKQVHQRMDTVDLFRPITKYSVEIDAPASVSEVVANAFRTAESGRPGAAFISAPADIMTAAVDAQVLTPAAPEPLGPADAAAIATAARLINQLQQPVLMLGLLASEPPAAQAARKLLARAQFPVVCTYQGAGVVSRELFHCFGGRVGLFRNQLGDQLLDEADLVVTIGYYPMTGDLESRWPQTVEMDPQLFLLGPVVLRVYIATPRTYALHTEGIRLGLDRTEEPNPGTLSRKSTVFTMASLACHLVAG